MQEFIYKIDGNDVIIVSKRNRSWYFTNQQGLRVWQDRGKGISFLAKREEQSPKEIQEFIEDIEETLLSETPEQTSQKGGTIHLLNQCNLTCSYCRYSCHNNLPGTVSKESISWYIGELAKEKAGILTLTGGEPTLRWDLVKHAVGMARKHGITTNILSNGKTGFCPEQIGFLRDNQVNLQISLDSLDDDVNIKTRTVDSGTIQRTIKDLVTGNIRCGVSMVLNRFNCNEVDDMIRWCLQNGVSYLHFPFLEKGGRADHAWDMLSLSVNEIKPIFDKLFNVWSKGDVPLSFFHEFQTLREKIEEPHTMVSCNAGINNSCLAPDGLYPCTNFVGNPSWRIGKVFVTSLTTAKTSFGKEHDFSYQRHTICRDCDWGWVCCGGCRDRANLANGIDPYCEIFKFLTEKIMWHTVRDLEQKQKGGDEHA